MAFGTVFTLDAVANQQTTIAEIDQDDLWANLDAYFDAHNRIFTGMMGFIAETTTDRLRRYGNVADMVAQELDEFGQPSAQKIAPPGANVGFPLRRFGLALQWTRFYFEIVTAEEFGKEVNGITDADEQRMYRELRRAIFTPTNTTFTDIWEMPRVDLPVKRLVNADGDPIPTSPGGTTFDGGTHTHYLGVTTGGTPTQADVEELIDHVVEHFNTGTAVVAISRADEGDFKAFADFKEYVDARLVDQRTELVASGNLDLRNIYDRAIGLLHGAEIWVKPWMPAGYAFAYLNGVEPPLVQRIPKATGAVGLRLVAEDENYPLRAREWEHRYGVAVWNRLNGAVLDMVTGGDTYTAPTLT